MLYAFSPTLSTSHPPTFCVYSSLILCSMRFLPPYVFFYIIGHRPTQINKDSATFDKKMSVCVCVCPWLILMPPTSLPGPLPGRRVGPYSPEFFRLVEPTARRGRIPFSFSQRRLQFRARRPRKYFPVRIGHRAVSSHVSKVTRTRVPVAAIGCPREIPDPLTLT